VVSEGGVHHLSGGLLILYCVGVVLFCFTVLVGTRSLHKDSKTRKKTVLVLGVKFRFIIRG
jgi:hypothetical protein